MDKFPAVQTVRRNYSHNQFTPKTFGFDQPELLQYRRSLIPIATAYLLFPLIKGITRCHRENTYLRANQ